MIKDRISHDWLHIWSRRRGVIYVPSNLIPVNSCKQLKIWSMGALPELTSLETAPGTVLHNCYNGVDYYGVALPSIFTNTRCADYNLTDLIKKAFDTLPQDAPLTVFLPECSHQLTKEQYDQVVAGLEASTTEIILADLEIPKRHYNNVVANP